MGGAHLEMKLVAALCFSYQNAGYIPVNSL